MIWIALALLLQDQEPNNNEEEIKQAIAPGGAFEGSLADLNDRDWIAVECERETLCSLFFTGTRAHFGVLLGQRLLLAHLDYKPVQILRLRLPKGRTSVLIQGFDATQYRLEVKVVDDLDAAKEVEPNDSVETAQPLEEGGRRWGQMSGFDVEKDTYALEIRKAGPYRIVLKRLRPDPKTPLAGVINVLGLGGDPIYRYRIREIDDEFHFYPVLPEGLNFIEVYLFAETPAGDAYELTVAPHDIRVPPDEVRRAEDAIARGVAWLMSVPPDREKNDGWIASEGLALAALSEGKGAKERAAALERDFAAWFEPHLEPTTGTWEGRAVPSFGGMYAHSMATLGLAEAAANGSAKARELAGRAADFLMAAQRTERRCAEWKPVEREGHHYGTWRYEPNAEDGDLSVGGWCIVALTAVDAAGIKRAGMRDAIEASLAGVTEFAGDEGFGYETRDGGSNIMNGVGALVCLLYGQESSTLGAALADLDRHLPAATQVDHGATYVYYYLYYATRVNFLRSGRVWETWRSVTLRQLLRRQKADGSWESFDSENHAGSRWTTAIAVMVLRLCLNEAPKYLKLEVKGF